MNTKPARQTFEQNAPVRLRYDKPTRGKVVRPGPEQSIVRWVNGNENCVSNTWIEPIDDEPNMQNIPVRTEEGRKVRNALIQATRADAVAVDFAQIEARVIAQMAEKSKRPKAPDDDLVADIKAKCTDDASLKAFAVANGVWDDKYDALPNPGLRRMNIVNRLRAKIKKQHVVVWP